MSEPGAVGADSGPACHIRATSKSRRHSRLVRGTPSVGQRAEVAVGEVPGQRRDRPGRTVIAGSADLPARHPRTRRGHRRLPQQHAGSVSWLTGAVPPQVGARHTSLHQYGTRSPGRWKQRRTSLPLTEQETRRAQHNPSEAPASLRHGATSTRACRVAFSLRTPANGHQQPPVDERSACIYWRTPIY